MHGQWRPGAADLGGVLLKGLDAFTGKNLQSVLLHLTQIADVRDGRLEGVGSVAADLDGFWAETQPDFSPALCLTAVMAVMAPKPVWRKSSFAPADFTSASTQLVSPMKSATKRFAGER